MAQRTPGCGVLERPDGATPQLVKRIFWTVMDPIFDPGGADVSTDDRFCSTGTMVASAQNDGVLVQPRVPMPSNGSWSSAST